ncbi:MAG: kelch repeat-containing protein [bacterium]
MMRNILLSAMLALPFFGCGDDSQSNNNDQTNQNNNSIPLSCGNGVLEGLEECDSGEDNSDTLPDVCRSNCLLPSCGDGVTDTNEECDNGQDNSDEIPDACRTNCLLPSCGDGVIDSGETCDDAGNNSDTTPNACRTYCAAPTCGDGVTDNFFSEECDDGGMEAHDGCSNLCQTEQLAWSRLGEIFQERQYHAIAYDSARDVVVLFGGQNLTLDQLNDTWEYDGTLWRRVNTPNSPGPRMNHAMAYDSQRQRVVLYGGMGVCSNPNACPDTWEYDGTDWVEITTTNNPPGLHMHRLSYDSARGVVVLFAGQPAEVGFSPPWGGTWEYNGTDWTERTFSTNPYARRQHGMAYDASRGVTVVWGGICFNGMSTGICANSPVWEYNGTGWTPVTAFAPLPVARSEHGMAYLPTGQVVLYGGADVGNNYVEDTWIWHGSYWAAVSPGNEPGPRVGTAMAYAAGWSQLVLFDGYTTGDTWEFDGTAWTRAMVRPTPSSRERHAMAYDASRDVTVLFGGQPWSGRLGDTWEFDGAAWSEATPTVSPAPRYQHAMAYEAAGQRVLLFGGATMASTNGTNDTWAYNGSTWVDLAPANAPPARRSAAMAYDPGRSRIVLFGGSSIVGAALGDTWEWDGTNWSQATPATAPPSVMMASMSYDPDGSRILLYGGYTGLNASDEVWAYDGTDWVQLQMSAVDPEPRWQAGLGYHDAAGLSVVYAGMDGGQYFDDLWSASGTTWTQLTTGLSPSPRHSFGTFVYHDSLHALLFFGGRGTVTTSARHQDTWILRLDETP